MRYLAQIALAILLAIGADVAIYAYAARELPRPEWGSCLNPRDERETRAAAARFESHAIGASAMIVNGATFACICATLIRRRRDRERLAGD
jgi:hypothetical protein